MITWGPDNVEIAPTLLDTWRPSPWLAVVVIVAVLVGLWEALGRETDRDLAADEARRESQTDRR